MEQGKKFIKTVQELKKELADGQGHDFAIILGGGVAFSRKIISYDGTTNKYELHNCIDDTDQILTEKELLDKDITHIKKAMDNNAFVLID
jgi:hypothetical protein